MAERDFIELKADSPDKAWYVYLYWCSEVVKDFNKIWFSFINQLLSLSYRDRYGSPVTLESLNRA